MGSRGICKGCGKELTVDERGNVPRPCPECGSEQLEWSETLADEVTAGDGFGALGRDSQGASTFVDESRVDGNTHSADDTGSGTHVVTSGEAPQKEEGALEVCKRLAKAWSNEAQQWEAEENEAEDEVDCFITEVDSGRTIKAQVTRLHLGQSFFEKLGNDGEVEVEQSYSEVVERMLAAVRKKKASYSDRLRSELVLVLDAVRAPSGVLGNVIEAARKRSEAFAAAGFVQVWVVGPLSGTVHRLDSH